MYREALRSCPGCRSPMQPVRLALGVGELAMVNVCGACGAGFFDYFAGELAQLARALMHTDAAPPVAPYPVMLNDVSCPDCAETLSLRLYLEEGPLLYLCNGCLATFVTAKQIRLLADYEHTRKASHAVLRALVERLGVA